MRLLVLGSALICVAAAPIQAPPQPDFSAIQRYTAAREKKFAEMRCTQEALKSWQTLTPDQRDAQIKACRAAQ